MKTRQTHALIEIECVAWNIPNELWNDDDDAAMYKCERSRTTTEAIASKT